MRGLDNTIFNIFIVCSIHLCCTLIHTKPGAADQFINAVKEETALIMKDPKAKCGGIVSIPVFFWKFKPTHKIFISKQLHGSLLGVIDCKTDTVSF